MKKMIIATSVVATILVFISIYLVITSKISVKSFKGKDYYIIKNDYQKEYNLQYLNDKINNDFIKNEIMSYDDYKNYCSFWNIKQEYNDSNKNYAVLATIGYNTESITARLADVTFNKDNINLYVYDKIGPFSTDNKGYIIIVPVSKKIKNMNVNALITDHDFENIKNGKNGDEELMVDKPVIYLYPTVPTNISIKLIKENYLTVTYPKYFNSWEVFANINGDLIINDKKYYSLFYESKQAYDFKVEDEGFIVERENITKFLEEKLSILGLNYKESEEFILYWLPILQKSKYNYIRFASIDEINANMPINIDPKPDTEIRILITYKGIDKPFKIQNQKLFKQERNGYTFVEWGGTKIN